MNDMAIRIEGNRTGERSGHKFCSVLGCARSMRAKGLCSVHYRRRYDHSRNRMPIGGEPLTRMQDKCMAMLNQDLTTKQIARELGLSWKTVLTHLHMAYRKLDVHSKLSACRAWVRLRNEQFPLLRKDDLAVINTKPVV